MGNFVGIAVTLSGQTLRALTVGLVYIKRGGRNKQVYAEKLVQSGIFSHCRNPLYLGNLLILTGVGIVSNSGLFVALGLPFLVFAYLSIIHAEENYLRNKFGQEFKDYCNRVNRIIPNLSGMVSTIRSMEFHWKRLVVKEYATPFAWIMGTAILIIRHIYHRWGYEGSKNSIIGLVIFSCLLRRPFLLYGT